MMITSIFFCFLCKMISKKSNVVILNASARNEGNTARLIDYIIEDTDWEQIKLSDYRIEHFEYNKNDYTDDFISLLEQKVLQADLIIFASPIYWYCMSGLMKVFLDRLTVVIQERKDLGYQLKGKPIAVLSCGSDSLKRDGYYMPFKETAKYLSMNYITECHGWINRNEISLEVIKILDDFKSEMLENK